VIEITEKNDLKICSADISSVDDIFEPEFVWYVHSAGYKVKTTKSVRYEKVVYDYLAPDVGAGERTIYPLVGSELLLQAFVSINPDDHASILGFTNRYGLLEEYRRNIHEHDLLISIGTLKEEVNFIRSLLGAWEAAQEPTPSNLEYLKSIFTVYSDPESEEEDSFVSFTLSCTTHRRRGILLYNEFDGVDALANASPPELSPEDYPKLARTLVMQYLNDRLRDYPTVMQIFLDSNGGFVARLKPKDLISAIWLQFLQYVTGSPTDDGSKIVRCAFCGKRGRFDGTWREGGKKEKYKGMYYHITCHDRVRQRELRELKKTQKTSAKSATGK
jgi:hypothetical protein